MGESEFHHPGDRGKLLHLDEIAELTRMPKDSIRSRYHRGAFPPLFKLGKRLVAWESEVLAWMDEQKEATTKGDRS